MAVATTSDVVNRWRPLLDEEAAVATTRLNDVERMIRRRITDLDDRMTADPNFRLDVIQVEADAVIRLLKNPEGKRQESIDDYSWTLDRSISDGVLRILRSEWALLGAPMSAGSRKAFMVDTTPAAATVRDC